MIQAVIFDFDGVIGDTMADNCIAWQEAFAPYGVALPAAEYYKLEGMGRFQIAEHIASKHGLNHDIIKDVAAAKEHYYKHHNTFKIFDGVTEIFSFLKQKNIPIAIVTGASKARITEHLDASLVKQISVLITADHVINTKPHPEPYLKAAKLLNKPAKDCLVIENAILGIQSAKAAGCQCFALETTLSKEDLTIADEIFATHKELLTKFERII